MVGAVPSLVRCVVVVVASVCFSSCLMGAVSGFGGSTCIGVVVVVSVVVVVVAGDGVDDEGNESVGGKICVVVSISMVVFSGTVCFVCSSLAVAGPLVVGCDNVTSISDPLLASSPIDRKDSAKAGSPNNASKVQDEISRSCGFFFPGESLHVNVNTASSSSAFLSALVSTVKVGTVVMGVGAEISIGLGMTVGAGASVGSVLISARGLMVWSGDAPLPAGETALASVLTG